MVEHIEKLQPNLARVIFKARTRMFDIKVNFKKNITLMLGAPCVKGKMEPLTICLHVIPVYSALRASIQSTNLTSFFSKGHCQNFEKLEIPLQILPKYREEIL